MASTPSGSPSLALSPLRHFWHGSSWQSSRGVLDSLICFCLYIHTYLDEYVRETRHYDGCPFCIPSGLRTFQFSDLTNDPDENKDFSNRITVWPGFFLINFATHWPRMRGVFCVAPMPGRGHIGSARRVWRDSFAYAVDRGLLEPSNYSLQYIYFSWALMLSTETRAETLKFNASEILGIWFDLPIINAIFFSNDKREREIWGFATRLYVIDASVTLTMTQQHSRIP